MITEISDLVMDVAKLGPIGKNELRAVVRRLRHRKGGARVAKILIRYADVEIGAVWVYLLGSPALDHCSLNQDCRQNLLL